MLGAWLEHSPGTPVWQQMSEDLNGRGVENIDFVAGGDPSTLRSALSATFPAATLLDQASSPTGQARSSSARSRSHSPALAVRGTDAALLMTEALRRAFSKHRRFDDDDVIASFALEVLQRAECQIDVGSRVRGDTPYRGTSRRPKATRAFGAPAALA